MSIHSLSAKLAAQLANELNYSGEKEEIIAYAIETALLFAIGLILVLLLGFILNALSATILVVLFGGLLRRLSGGAHFNSPLKCMFIGSVVYALLGFLSELLFHSGITDKILLIPVLVVCLLMVALLAPVDSAAKPIQARSFKVKLKIAAILFVGISLSIVIISDYSILNVSVTLGILYQCVTLLPYFNSPSIRGGEYGL
jgi:accessory gene regulator B